MVLVEIKKAIFGSNNPRLSSSSSSSSSSKKTINERTSLLPTSNSDDSLTLYAATTQDDASSISLDSVQKFINPRVLSDVVIGLSDGLTVPFALTAGLALLGDSKLVITGGLAELVSGAISMGLGGYLAAKGETEYYKSSVEREREAIKCNPEKINEELLSIFEPFNLSRSTIALVQEELENVPASSKDKLIDFLIHFGKDLNKPAEGRQFWSALTIGFSYFFGGFIPLLPYFFTQTVQQGLYISIILMLVTLFLFGYFKTIFTIGSLSVKSCIEGGLCMTLVGGAAAGSAWLLVRLVS